MLLFYIICGPGFCPQYRHRALGTLLWRHDCVDLLSFTLSNNLTALGEWKGFCKYLINVKSMIGSSMSEEYRELFYYGECFQEMGLKKGLLILDPIVNFYS